MLEQKDLQAIAELIDTRFSKTEGRLDALEGRFDALEGKVEALDKKITNVERTLVNELVRTEDKLFRRIGRVEKILEGETKYFGFNKLDNGEAELTLRLLKVAQC